MNNVTDVLEIVRQFDVSKNNLPEAFLKLIVLYMLFFQADKWLSKNRRSKILNCFPKCS